MSFLASIGSGLISGAASAGINELMKTQQSKPASAPIANPLDNQSFNSATNMQNQNINSQQQLISALAANNGAAHQQAVYDQQQGLAGQLQNLANGQGPNPALAQLANQTGQNINQQAALMAGQRGAGANAGLIARQAAQQGGALQQNAIGQGAALQAQQQLNAYGALQNQQNMLAGTAQNQIGNQQAAIGQAGQLASAQQQAIGSAMQGVNNANVQQQAGINNIQNAQGMQQAEFLGKGLGGATSGLGAGLMKAEGGMIEDPKAPKSYMTRHLCGGGIAMQSGGAVPGTPQVGGTKNSYSNDTVPALLSPGEIVLPRSVTQAPDPKASAMKFIDALLAKQGKK